MSGDLLSRYKGTGFQDISGAYSLKVGGTTRMRVLTTGQTGFAGAAPDTAYSVDILSLNATTKTLRCRGSSAQTAVLQEWSDNTGNMLAQIASDGGLTTPTITGAVVAAQAGMENGTSLVTVVSPGRQQFHPSASKMWAKFDTAAVISGSYNISGITDIGTGKSRVTLTTAFTSSAWTCVPGMQAQNSRSVMVDASAGTPQAAGAVDLLVLNTIDAVADPNFWYVVGFGDQA